MTNKELGSAIRATLKTAGYAPRDISVRVRECGYSTSASVTIKNPEIRRESVERLLSKFESIDRDYATGEILAGGNCYLFTDYADGIFDVPAQEMATTAAGILRETRECIRILTAFTSATSTDARSFASRTAAEAFRVRSAAFRF